MTDTVTQEDRDAAADYLHDVGETWERAGRIRRGEEDHHLVGVLTRHRQQSTAAKDAEIAELRFDNTRLRVTASDYMVEVERLTANMAAHSIHTCSDVCDRPVCVLRRENEALRRNVRGWKRWHDRVENDAYDDCEYLNGNGWPDAEALASTAMGLLARQALDPDAATGCADDALPGSADDWRNFDHLPEPAP